MPARTDRQPGRQDPNVQTEGELADDFDHTREEINQRYLSSHPTDANAPPSAGGRLPAADLPGPGPLPAQGHDLAGVAGPDLAAERAVTHRPGATALSVALDGRVLDERGREVPPALARSLLERALAGLDDGGGGSSQDEAEAAAGKVPVAGAKSAPGILAKALGEVRKHVTSMAAITGCKDAAKPYTEGTPGESEELAEGEQAAPFNKSLGLPAQVSKIVQSLRRKSISLATAGQSGPVQRAVGNAQNPGVIGADVAHLAGRNLTGTAALEAVQKAQSEAVAGAEAGPLGNRGQGGASATPTVRRDGGLTGLLKEQAADRLQLQGTGQGKLAGAGDGTIKLQGQGQGQLGKGTARVDSSSRSGGTGHGRGK
jgi:hypothetical protein